MVQATYPALAQLATPGQYQALRPEERRQALALLGDAYRSLPAQREGLYSLALLAVASFLKGLRGSDLDPLLEALLLALVEGRDAERTVEDRAKSERRGEARRCARHAASRQLAPTTARLTPALTLPQALARLTPKYQRVAVWLAEGYEGPEIAALLGIKPGAARELISQVRKALRLTLG